MTNSNTAPSRRHEQESPVLLDHLVVAGALRHLQGTGMPALARDFMRLSASEFCFDPSGGRPNHLVLNSPPPRHPLDSWSPCFPPWERRDPDSKPCFPPKESVAKHETPLPRGAVMASKLWIKPTEQYHQSGASIIHPSLKSGGLQQVCFVSNH